MKHEPTAKRAYTRHRLQHVKQTRDLYPDHTRKEIAALLGLTPEQIKGICRRHRIGKNRPRQPHAAQVLPIVNNNEIQYLAAA